MDALRRGRFARRRGGVYGPGGGLSSVSVMVLRRAWPKGLRACVVLQGRRAGPHPYTRQDLHFVRRGKPLSGVGGSTKPPAARILA